MTVLVDTSVWIDHLRRRLPPLALLLEDGAVLGHAFVIGELAVGNLRQWGEIRGHLEALPPVLEASHDEVLRLIDRHGLHGSGIGWVDAHLLASARLTGCRLWTRDRALGAAAGATGVALESP